MLSMSGGMLMVWLRVWIASIGVPAAMRPMTGTATGRPPSSSEAARTRPRLPSMTLGVKPRERPNYAVGDQFRQLDHFDGARPIGQPADEAALFQRGDQPVDAGFRPQVQRVLHLVEGGRYARLLQALVDKPQELGLFARQHRVPLWSGSFQKSQTSAERPPSIVPKQIMNEHYPFHMCSATI